MDDLTRQEVRVSEWKLTPLVCSTWIRTLDFGMVEEFPKMCQAVNIRKLKTLEGDLKNHNVASEVSKGTSDLITEYAPAPRSPSGLPRSICPQPTHPAFPPVETKAAERWDTTELG
ncbi:uncharacterized protein LOC143156506 isoform X2 [Aptenodytes patagonicus]|uniref:uncharacterized protein LOC143156506 isoform X2 n=1 Tax=Aptenodytes patagonicus TaxID=9234 RepID=UPI003F9EDAFC